MLRHLLGGVLQPHPLLLQSEDLRHAVFQCHHGAGFGSGSGHHKDVFALGGVLLVIGHGLGQGETQDLLVELGQFPAQGDPAVRAEGLHQVIQCGAELVRGFVEDHGPGLVL